MKAYINFIICFIIVSLPCVYAQNSKINYNLSAQENLENLAGKNFSKITNSYDLLDLASLIREEIEPLNKNLEAIASRANNIANQINTFHNFSSENQCSFKEEVYNTFRLKKEANEAKLAELAKEKELLNDIVNLFIEYLNVTYGKETIQAIDPKAFNENLNFQNQTEVLTYAVLLTSIYLENAFSNYDLTLKTGVEILEWIELLTVNEFLYGSLNCYSTKTPGAPTLSKD